jgi:hypothetical protein
MSQFPAGLQGEATMRARSPLFRCLPVLVLTILLTACAEEPTGPTRPPKPSLATDAYCALYPWICSPSTEDPAPNAIGYYGGGAITDQHCAGESGGTTDLDQDGLADDCEHWLALKFAPKMLYDRADDVRRESYWAAKPIKIGLVRVFYALGYYFDLGTTADCYINISLCEGHSGDSEWVTFDLKYNRSTQHWYLYAGQLSAHEYIYPLTPSTSGWIPWLTYPDRAGGYPLIFVARQKHANYPTREICNDGSVFGSDDCESNDQSFRPDVLASRNLGSNGYRLLNKVASTYSFYQNPVRYEYMWSSSYFFGWQLDHTTHARGYGPILREQGF